MHCVYDLIVLLTETEDLILQKRDVFLVDVLTDVLCGEVDTDMANPHLLPLSNDTNMMRTKYMTDYCKISCPQFSATSIF